MNDHAFKAPFARCAVWLALAALCATGCGDAADSGGPVPIRFPDLSGMAPEVREQLDGQRARLEALRDGGAASPAELGQAYGRMGMLLHLYEFDDAARACYESAIRDAPDDHRWPHLLGHLEFAKARFAEAAAAFRSALAARPDSLAAQTWLAESLRNAERLDEAEPLFREALERDPGCVPARFGLGRIALERGDPERAVELLEAVLARVPDSRRVHYQLGLAYRALGRLDRAQLHLARGVDAAVAGETFDPVMFLVDDPVLQEFQRQAASREQHVERGTIALERGRLDVAEQELRRALELDPDHAEARLKLGVTLARAGAPAARRELEQLLEMPGLHPQLLRVARLEYGFLLEQDGALVEAEREYLAVLRQDPHDADANTRAARVSFHRGRYGEALDRYARVLAARPADGPAHFWRGVTLARLGRWPEARDALERGLAAAPGDPVLTQALARILAAAPDDEVRDGARGLELMRGLATSGPHSLGQARTMAMALAENGRFDEALDWQQRVVGEAERRGESRLLPELRAELDRYGRNEPCRRPWSPNDPVLRGPGA